MLVVSREVKVKIARHSWNVFPLEAFGYLLGRADNEEVLVALPYSKTKRWHEFEDRWNGIEEQLPEAEKIAKCYGLGVVGFYASTEDVGSRGANYSTPGFIGESTMGLLCIYTCVCCPSCSWISFISQGRPLARDEDYIIPKGKRAQKEINQRRVHGAWIDRVGPIDYSNGYQEQLCCPTRRST